MSILINLNSFKKNISLFLKDYVLTNNGFNARSFYGETFSLALLSRNNMLNMAIRLKLYDSFDRIDKDDSQFHWEFNNYALLDYIEHSKDKSFNKFLKPLKFKHSTSTNWTLLRSNTRLKANKDKVLAIKEAKDKINTYQLESGLILDDVGVKSFQYHCFSMAMVAEIYESTQDTYFKDSFLKGVEFIRYFILSNGDSLYIGRGQNQSFGYGTLIYILAMAYSFTKDKTLLGDIYKVSNFLKKYQRENGSFPLVMNGIEKNIPKVVDMNSDEFVGWYAYNNYFDYLPFMGFFIAKAYKILETIDTSFIEYKDSIGYKDENFRKIVKCNYEAIISKTGGYWTNDISIPYIVTKSGRNITPIYGGEQFEDSLYTLEGIPLPYCNSLGKSIRWRSKSYLMDNILLIISPLGIMKREYIFDEEYIDIKTSIISPFNFKHIYLLLHKNQNVIDNINDLEYEGYEYSTNGKLKKYIDRNRVSKIRILIES